MRSFEFFRNILVGVDPQGLSAGAMRRAAELGHAFGARFELVQVVDVPAPFWPGMETVPRTDLAAMQGKALAAARENLLEQARTALRTVPGSWDVEDLVKVLPGLPAEVLLRRAEDRGADLFVLGPHAKTSLLDFGSTARAVLSQSRIPVWSQGEQVSPVKSVLVAVDFSDHSRQALEVALGLAARMGAKLRVMTCYSPPVFAYANAEGMPGTAYVIEGERKAVQDRLLRWVDELDRGEVQVESVFIEGEVHKDILRTAAEDDLIVMGTHGRTGLSRFLLGSVAYSVLRQADKPVLVVPNPERSWLLGETAQETPAGAPPDSSVPVD